MSQDLIASLKQTIKYLQHRVSELEAGQRQAVEVPVASIFNGPHVQSPAITDHAFYGPDLPGYACNFGLPTGSRCGRMIYDHRAAGPDPGE